MEFRYTATFEKDGELWTASAEEIPGTFTQAATLKEAWAKLQNQVRQRLDERGERDEKESLN